MTNPQKNNIRKIIFAGLNGFDFPETRIRCRNFADILKQYGWETEVFSFRERFLANKPEVSMFNLPDSKRQTLVEKAIKQIEQMGPAILYIQKVHYHSAAPYQISKRLGWPMILDYDDYDLDRSPLFNDRTLSEKYFSGFGAEQITSNLAKHAALCITASQPLHNLVSRWNPSTHLIETGVDTKKFIFNNRKTNSPTKRIIWTGQIWGEPIMRSLELCFQTARLLYRDGCDFTLELYGRGHEAEVNRHIHRKYPNIPIEYKGWVTPDQMASVMADADVGLYPLVFSNIDHDWMSSKSPTKMFEYMAAGIPVASVNINETRRVLDNGNAGLLCKNEFEMAQKIQHLFDNPDYRNNLTETARSRIETNYSLDILGSKLNNILHAIK